MDKNLIELTAINKLEAVLLKTDRVRPDISKNDTIPSWDGQLIVYNRNGISKKEDIIGKIDVQVKGSFKEDLSSKEIKYQVDMNDLKNYYKTGGCIYFVVYLSDFDNYKIYYSMLLPFDLKKLICGHEKQKYLSLQMEELPEKDIDLVNRLLRSFIKNQKKQISVIEVDYDLTNLSLEQMKDLECLSFNLEVVNGDMFDKAFKMPTYVYAKIAQGKVEIPVQKVVFEQIIVNEVAEKVFLNDKPYFNSVSIEKSIDKEVYHFGKGFTCDSVTEKISYNIKGNLEERINDLNFFLALSSKQKNILKIGKYFEAQIENDISPKEIQTFEDILTYYVEVSSALKVVGVKEILECDRLNRMDENNLSILLNGIIGHKLISHDGMNDLPKISLMQIGNINIPVYIHLLPEHGGYMVESLYHCQEPDCYYDKDDKENSKTSVHLLMKKNAFLCISNIDYNVIYTSITSKPFTAEQSNRITEFVLNALNAYDENKNVELLCFIERLTEWQKGKESNAINELNYLQTIKRKRRFTASEIKSLNKIKSEAEDNMISLGVSILLESKVEIDFYWDNLDEGAKMRFSGYPINHLRTK